MNIGYLLIRKRLELRFSQQDIADKVGVSQSTYSSWESEKSQPKLEEKIKLALFFDIPIEILITKEQWEDLRAIVRKGEK